MFNNKNEVTKVPAPAICPVSVKEEIEKVQKTYDDLIRRFFCTISHYNGYSVIDYNNFWARRFESYISMKEAEAKTRAERARIRAVYAGLSSICDGCVTLTAPGAAPLGIESTGNPIFAVPFSLLGVPAISLPLLQDQSLPLGLQVTGFSESDADTFAIAAWLMQELGGVDG